MPKVISDYDRACGIGDVVSEWLAEKLSTGQLVSNKHTSYAHDAVDYYFIGMNNSVSFQILDVSKNYWYKLILPGLQGFAKQFNCYMTVTGDDACLFVKFTHVDPSFIGVRVE